MSENVENSPPVAGGDNEAEKVSKKALKKAAKKEEKRSVIILNSILLSLLRSNQNEIKANLRFKIKKQRRSIF